MIIEFASEVSNLAWRVSQSQNGGAIFARTKWSPMFGSVVFDYQWCILIVMSVKSSFYNEYDIKNNEKPVFWAQRGFQNHHQTFHDRCPEKIGPLPKKSDHWSTRTCPENIRPAPTCIFETIPWNHVNTVWAAAPGDTSLVSVSRDCFSMYRYSRCMRHKDQCMFTLHWSVSLSVSFMKKQTEMPTITHFA